MGNLKDLYFIGHSLGGYLVGNYVVKYPQYVKKFILASPVGVCPELSAGEKKSWADLVKNQAEPPVFVEPFMKFVWKSRITEFDALRFLGNRMSHFIMSQTVPIEYEYLPEHEQKAILEYKFQALMQKGLTEKSITVQFDVSL